MKSALTYFFILAMFFRFSTTKASDFYLRLQDNSPFTVIFNQSNPSYGCRFFQINNLVPGNYSIEIYNSCLSLNSPCFLPIYRGVVGIPQGCQLMAYLDVFNRLQTSNTVSLYGIPTFGYRQNNTANYRNNYAIRRNNLNDSLGFLEAKKVLSETSNSQVRLAYLKHSIYFHGITAQKLAELMLEFSFDKDRLDLAGYAYPFITDTENYYKIYDSLIFSGSKQQLDDYLYYLSSNYRY